jgi:hypothetical protein
MQNRESATFSVSQLVPKVRAERKNRSVLRGKWLGGPESAGKLTSREREGLVNDAGLDADRILHVYYPLKPSRPSFPTPCSSLPPPLLPFFPPLPPLPSLPPVPVPCALRPPYSLLSSLDMTRRTSPHGPPSRDKQPRTFRLTINALLSLPVSVEILVTHYLFTPSSIASSLQSPSRCRQGSLLQRSVYLDQ